MSQPEAKIQSFVLQQQKKCPCHRESITSEAIQLASTMAFLIKPHLKSEEYWASQAMQDEALETAQEIRYSLGFGWDPHCKLCGGTGYIYYLIGGSDGA